MLSASGVLAAVRTAAVTSPVSGSVATWALYPSRLLVPTMPRFGIHRRYGPILGHTPRYPPSAFPVSRFHVLARHHSQQTHSVGLFRIQPDVVDCFDQPPPVAYQPVHQLRALSQTSRRTVSSPILMSYQHQVGLRYQTPATPYLR